MNAMIRKTITPLFLFLFFAGSVAAQNGPSEGYARDIYDASSLSRFIKQTSSQIDELVAGSSSELTPEEAEEFEQIIRSSFNKDDLEKDVLSSMMQNMNADAAPRVLEWLNTPFTQRMQMMEAQPDPDDGALAAYVGTLDVEDEATKERIGVFQTYVTDTGAAEAMVNILSTMMSAMMRAGMAVSDEEDTMTDEELNAQVEMLRTELLPQYEQAVLVLMMYYFREASTEDMRQYAAYYTTEDGAWYNKLTAAAMENAFEGAAGRMGTLIGAMGN